MPKTIPLGKTGRVTLVDDEDYERVRRYRWFIVQGHGRTDYVQGKIERRWIRLHQFLLGDHPGLVIDHKNGDGLDNRRENLRFATVSQNKANGTKYRTPTGRNLYKGVYTRPGRRKFRACIRKDGKLYDLGYYPTAVEAALVYDAAAHRLFGEFAKLNFPNNHMLQS